MEPREWAQENRRGRGGGGRDKKNKRPKLQPENGTGAVRVGEGAKMLSRRKARVCVKPKRSKPLKPQLGKMGPPKPQGLPTRRAPSPRENKAPGTAASPGCRRLQAADWGPAPPRWRRPTGDGSPGGARGPRRRAQRRATCCKRSGRARLCVSRGGVAQLGLEYAVGVTATATSPRLWRGRQWASAGRGTGGEPATSPRVRGEAAPRRSLRPPGPGLIHLHSLLCLATAPPPRGTPGISNNPTSRIQRASNP